jgi:Ca-activated chloride channel family protein
MVAWLLALTLQFSTAVELVEVYASVSTASGEPVEHLAKDDFVVRDGGVPQPITVFAAGESELSVALALDRSWSMAGERLAVAKSAAHSFLGALAPRDQAMLIGVANRAETLAPLTTDRQALHRGIAALDPWGATALHDAVLTALDTIESARGRRALVLLSDGEDRESEHGEADVLERARRGDVLIYPVAMARRMPPLFEELASVSGGRAFLANDLSKLAPSFAAIARELRHQYLLGFVPAPSRGDPEWRPIDVEVRRQDVHVRARKGYVAK